MLNKKEILIDTERLRIRTLSEADVCENYVNGLNDPEVNKFLIDARFTQHTELSVKDFVAKNLSSPFCIPFGLFTKEQNELIGTIYISKISNIHFSCDLGICLFRKDFWNKGYGTEAISRVVRYLFDILGLHYIQAEAYAENKASLSMFEKVGFYFQYEVKNVFRFRDSYEPVVFLGLDNKKFDFSQLKSGKLMELPFL